MRTTGAVLYGIGDIRLVDLEVPALGIGDVLVKIQYSGICGRQICEYRGIYGEDKWLPHLLGHEAYGEVVEIGQRVSKVAIGDHVVVSWIKGSGIDNQANRKYGDINGGPVTTFITYTVTCESRVTKVEVDPEVGALLGCAVPTGGGIVMHQVEALPGDTICIVGLGGIGSSAALIAKYMHYRVVAVDIYDKSDYADLLGIDEFIQIGRSPIEYRFGNVIECTGSEQGAQIAVDLTNRDGGKCIIAGNPPKGSVIHVDPYDLIHGKRLVGTWGGNTNPDIDIPMYARLPVSYKLLIGAVLPFTTVCRAIDYDMIAGRVNGRVLLDMQS
jgi:S-(hydroxymethyl)glutathione dehydrogenase/alcohol dehydrogenase